MEKHLVCILYLMNGKLMFLQLCEGRIEELKVLTVNIKVRRQARCRLQVRIQLTLRSALGPWVSSWALMRNLSLK